MTMCPNNHEADFESAKRARYERLSLLTLDMAEAAGRCARDHKGEIDGRAVSRAMAALSRAVWAHQIIERLRQGQSLSRADLMRLALGEAYEERVTSRTARPRSQNTLYLDETPKPAERSEGERCMDDAKPDELINCPDGEDEPSFPAMPCDLENNIEEKNSDHWSSPITGPEFMVDEFMVDEFISGEVFNEGVCATFKMGGRAKFVGPVDVLTDNLAPP